MRVRTAFSAVARNGRSFTLSTRSFLSTRFFRRRPDFMAGSQPRGINFLAIARQKKHRQAIHYVGKALPAIKTLEEQPFHRGCGQESPVVPTSRTIPCTLIQRTARGFFLASEGGAGELDGRHVRRGMCIIRAAIRILDTGTNKTVAASVTRIFGRQALTSATASQAFRNPNREPYRKR